MALRLGSRRATAAAEAQKEKTKKKKEKTKTMEKLLSPAKPASERRATGIPSTSRQ